MSLSKIKKFQSQSKIPLDIVTNVRLDTLLVYLIDVLEEQADMISELRKEISNGCGKNIE